VGASAERRGGTAESGAPKDGDDDAPRGLGGGAGGADDGASLCGGLVGGLKEEEGDRVVAGERGGVDGGRVGGGGEGGGGLLERPGDTGKSLCFVSSRLDAQEKLKAARETALTVAKDTGTAAGNAAWDLARRARDGSLAQSASEVADVLSLPSRIAEASTKDDAAGAIAKAVDEWSRLPGVVSLAAASASSAQQLADAAQKSASAALADVEQRAESGELEDDAKSFFSVAGEVSRTVGLDTASSSLARAVGDAAVDVLSGALAQFSSSDEESFADSLNRAGARVSAAVDAAKNAAPAVAGFLAGLAVSWLFSLPSAFRLAYQRNEIARLTKDLDDANKKRAEATTSSSSSSSVVAPPAPASSSPSS